MKMLKEKCSSAIRRNGPKVTRFVLNAKEFKDVYLIKLKSLLEVRPRVIRSNLAVIDTLTPLEHQFNPFLDVVLDTSGLSIMPFGDTSRFTLEVCCSSIESLILAQNHGADRIELCQNLEQGGITPSYGMIKEALRQAKIPVHILIRPRPGNFSYNDHEIRAQCDDIELCRDLGCSGVVIGHAGSPAFLARHAGGMQITYHRQFDDSYAMEQSLEAIIDAGCHRILTSGGAATAEGGLHKLKLLVQLAGGRISIMAGAGISPENVGKIIRETGVHEIHASCKRIKPREQQTTSSSRGLFEADEITVDTEVLDRLVAEIRSL